MDRLRIDYQIECERCGEVADAPVSTNSTSMAIKYFEEKDWQLIDDENCCPDCAKENRSLAHNHDNERERCPTTECDN